MSRPSHVIAIAIALLLSAACSNNPLPEPPGPQDSIVYGYLDMNDAPVDLSWVSMRQFAPPTDEPYWSFGVDKGTFWNTYLDPGAYALESFGGSGFNSRYTFNVPRQDGSMRIVIDKPGIYYLGAFRYKNIKTGVFEPDKFDLERTDSPSEREVLEKLIVIMKGTVVEPKLQQRLRELSR